MKRILIALVLVLLLVTVGTNAHAQSKPVQLALFNPIQIFPENTSIAGIRISLIYGKNTSVSGIDWGLVNHTTSGKSLGWQMGLVGMNEANFVGLQSNFINIGNQNVEGVQWGFYNHAGYMNGLQFGFINHAESMKGLQIGLINIIKSGGQFPVFPIVNRSFLRCVVTYLPLKEALMAGRRRTTHRSVAGKKLYAVRDAKGRFLDIQTYERAHRADLKRRSKAEKKRKK